MNLEFTSIHTHHTLHSHLSSPLRSVAAASAMEQRVPTSTSKPTPKKITMTSAVPRRAQRAAAAPAPSAMLWMPGRDVKESCDVAQERGGKEGGGQEQDGGGQEGGGAVDAERLEKERERDALHDRKIVALPGRETHTLNERDRDTLNSACVQGLQKTHCTEIRHTSAGAAEDMGGEEMGEGLGGEFVWVETAEAVAQDDANAAGIAALSHSLAVSLSRSGMLSPSVCGAAAAPVAVAGACKTAVFDDEEVAVYHAASADGGGGEDNGFVTPRGVEEGWEDIQGNVEESVCVSVGVSVCVSVGVSVGVSGSTSLSYSRGAEKRYSGQKQSATSLQKSPRFAQQSVTDGFRREARAIHTDTSRARERDSTKSRERAGEREQESVPQLPALQYALPSNAANSPLQVDERGSSPMSSPMSVVSAQRAAVKQVSPSLARFSSRALSLCPFLLSLSLPLLLCSSFLSLSLSLCLSLALLYLSFSFLYFSLSLFLSPALSLSLPLSFSLSFSFSLFLSLS